MARLPPGVQNRDPAGVVKAQAGAWALSIAVGLLAVACGGGSPGGATPSPSGGSPLPAENRSSRYPEGTVTIGISMLDVGLLKGDVTAQGSKGWRVGALKVTAVDPKGGGWGVLEFPEGVGSPSASEFFEVQLQELVRGEHVVVTATATFEDESGKSVERQASDVWPP